MRFPLSIKKKYSDATSKILVLTGTNLDQEGILANSSEKNIGVRLCHNPKCVAAMPGTDSVQRSSKR